VRDYEPRRALDGGPDGLAVLRRLVPAAPDLLLPGGWMALELGEQQAAAVRELAGQTGAFDLSTIETTTDAHDCERVFCVRRPASGGEH
jgi:release factor glutamine methyltransferase